MYVCFNNFFAHEKSLTVGIFLSGHAFLSSKTGLHPTLMLAGGKSWIFSVTIRARLQHWRKAPSRTIKTSCSTYILWSSTSTWSAKDRPSNSDVLIQIHRTRKKAIFILRRPISVSLQPCGTSSSLLYHKLELGSPSSKRTSLTSVPLKAKICSQTWTPPGGTDWLPKYS